MAQTIAPGSQTTNPRGQHAPHGKKRAAEGSLENEQRLSKRFDLLNLSTASALSGASPVTDKQAVDDNGTRHYIPVPGSTDATLTRPCDTFAAPHPLATTIPLAKPSRKPRPPRTITGMEVEDTPNRVYIHDLAAELSDIESDEDNPIFLSDIEKHLSKIPKHVLLGPEPARTEHNQMVLYNVPASLTVPEGQDIVRKAIVEARQRIREKQASPLSEPGRLPDAVGLSAGAATPEAEDEDAMDLD
jgi:hypothetical protein